DPVDVEPDVDVLEADLHEVRQAVPVDVVEADRVTLDVGVVRAVRHRNVAVLTKGVAGAIAPRARSPEAIPAAGPVPNLSAAESHDVDDAVAVHVGELGVLVAERHSR